MIKFIENYFSQKDERGQIKGLINFGEWQEFNLIFSEADTVRGGHYHEKTQELFIIIEGELNITLEDLNGNKEIYTVNGGDVFLIMPLITHTFKIIKSARWINVLSQRHNPQNPDFHKLAE
jgi:dTDP-4-dehydrorhamnose 3,5-epimerase-like enzyme